MASRGYSIGAYRFGFNGKEDDLETQTQDYGFRIYNPRLGKFLSIVPLSRKYAMLTPYQFASHSSNHGLFLDNGQYGLNYIGTKSEVSNSLTTTTYNIKNFYTDFVNNTNIKFTSDALVVFVGCNAGFTEGGNDRNIAAQFTMHTGIASIGADGNSMPVKGVNRVANRNYNLFYMDENDRFQVMSLGKTLDEKAIKTAQDKIADVEKLKANNKLKNEEIENTNSE